MLDETQVTRELNAPDSLLPDPEVHDRFRPTIEQIKNRFTVIHFDGSNPHTRRCR